MKNFIYIFFIATLSFCSKSVGTKSKLEIDGGKLYSVSEIDSVNSFYIVYLEGQGKKYKVVSKKATSNGCNKIEKEQEYVFVLSSILNEKVKLGDKEFSSSNSLMVDCFSFDEKTKICKEESKGIYDLFKTRNLIGLCYER